MEPLPEPEPEPEPEPTPEPLTTPEATDELEFFPELAPETAPSVAVEAAPDPTLAPEPTLPAPPPSAPASGPDAPGGPADPTWPEAAPEPSPPEAPPIPPDPPDDAPDDEAPRDASPEESAPFEPFLPPPEEAPSLPWLHPEHDAETTAPDIRIEDTPAPPEPPPALSPRFTPEPPRPKPADDDILARVPALEDLWLSGEIGVKANPEREKELGAGKWTEPARTREELAREMPSTPSRELSVEEAPARSVGGALALLFVGAVGVVLFLGWRLLSPEDSALSRVFGAPPTVTITTDPAGARVLFDGVDLGVSPAKLVIPDDREAHDLCAYKGDLKSCQELNADALRASEVFHVEFDGEEAN